MSSDSIHGQLRERKVRSVCAELDKRVRAGEWHVLESIFAAHPDLAEHEDSAIELVYAEFVAREDLGEPPTANELTQRFPQWQERLSRLLRVHEALQPAGDDTASPHETQTDARSTKTAGGGGKSRKSSSERIGQYEILGEIARGGMGVIYKATQQGLNRVVALKVIRSATATDSERARFRIEAEATARLQHPHIVPIYEIGEQDGCDYLSMEFVEGGNLEQHLAANPASPHHAAEMLATLAEAMHFAHERGVVHRDLKPGNVLLSLSGVPKIADFGLAKRLFEGGLGQTETGAILGTPCYMAPEQAEGRISAIGPATDIYALGAILYQMLTGHPPFEADTPMATLDMIRSREPLPPSRLSDRVPRDLETICLTCLQHEPSRRYGSAQALADDLRRFTEHEPILARPTRVWERWWRKARRRPLIASLCATLLVLIGVCAGIVLWQQRRVGEFATVTESTRKAAQQSQERASLAEANAESSFRKARELVDRWTRLGQDLMHQPGMGEISEQALEEALRHYEAFLSQRNDDPQMTLETARACERAGVIQMELGRFEKAELSLRRGVELYESLEGIAHDEFSRRRNLAGAHGQLGNARRRLEKWDASEQSYRKAISILESLLNAMPSNNEVAYGLSNVWVNLAQVFRQSDRDVEAQAAYAQAIRLQRSSISRRLIASDTSKRTVVEKIDTIEADNKAADETELLRSQAVRHLLVDEFPKVVNVLARESLLFEWALSLDDLGTLLNRRNRLKEAEASIRESLELRLITHKAVAKAAWCDSYLARSYEHLADVQTLKGDYTSAEQGYMKALELVAPLASDYPERLDYSRNVGSLHALLGDCMGRAGRLDESKDYFDKAIERQEQLLKKNPKLHFLERSLCDTILSRASILQRSRDYAGALANYRRATEVDKQSARAWNNMSWFLLSVESEELTDVKAAFEGAQKAVQLAPRRPTCWNTLGLAQYRLGKIEDALASIRKSIECRGDEGSVEDWFILAMVHAKLGQREQAQQWFDKADAWVREKSSNDELLKRFSAESTELLASLKADDSSGTP